MTETPATPDEGAQPTVDQPQDLQAPRDDVPVEQAAVDEVPVEQAAVDEVAVEETPVDEAPIQQAPVEDVPFDAAPVDEVAVDPAPVEDVPVDAALVEDAPVDAAPVDEVPIQQAPVDEIPDEVPAQVAVVGDAPAPEPMPAPAPRPTPAVMGRRAVPRPPAARPPVTRPAATATTPAAPVVAVPPLDPVAAAAAAQFGRVAEDGTVYVREAEDERAVGQVPGVDVEEALSLYVRRFLDLQTKVSLFEARLAATELSVKEIDQTVAKLTEELAATAAVGDLDALRVRLDGLRAIAAERRAAADAERAAAREAALAARTSLVEQAEQIAGTDPSKVQWRPAGDQLRILLDQWKDAQRNGPRLDRASEESLWKRFSHARTTFDRERRHYFAELEASNASARTAKENLVAEAESLATSTDWGPTSGAFRDLMTQWKGAGRASRPVDDALWARFRAAQDAFFAARDAAATVTDAEFAANLTVKEALLVEAEALVPVRNLAAAKSTLRSVQERWEAAGKVPRGDIQRIEARLRAAEQAVRDADDAQWKRTNPETRARAEGAAAQLEQVIAGLEADLVRATATGDQRKVAEAQAALDARRAWLEQIQRAAQDARG